MEDLAFHFRTHSIMHACYGSSVEKYFHVCHGPQSKDWGSKVLPTLSEMQVCDKLENLNIHKSIGFDEMHLREF